MKITTACLQAGLLVSVAIAASSVTAGAPVIDVSQDPGQLIASASQDQTGAEQPGDILMERPSQPAAALASQSMTLEQRVTRLERQLDYITRLNLAQQLSDSQRAMSQLQGQLQVQQHALKLLEDRQRSFYKDLDRRISQQATPAAHDAGVGGDDAKTYQLAVELLSKQQYDKAKTAFNDYLEKFPKGDFVANADYWLGEIAAKQGDFSGAAKSFATVVAQYPKSSKLVDAKFKLAMMHLKLGKPELARQQWLAIKQAYPGSTTAKLADISLQQLAASTEASTKLP